MTSDKKYNIILVDDHPYLRDGVRIDIQSDPSFEVIGEFSETRQLLNNDRKLHPDVIILDINLPGLNGIVSCERLRKKYENCKVVALTQYPDLQKELIKAGFDGYVVKTKSEVLLEAIHCVLGGRKFFHDCKQKNVTADPDDRDSFRNIGKLTEREEEIAQYIANDLSNREIAETLRISENTVKTHRKHIIEKLKQNKPHKIKLLLEEHGLDAKNKL
jgi:DNA-binding NarL/FixJ family response regulator